MCIDGRGSRLPSAQVTEIRAHTPVFGRGSSDTRPVCPGGSKSVTPHSHRCYGIGERPSPNHEGRGTGGGSHGDDTDSDEVIRETKSLVITKIEDFRTTPLAGPQPYEGDKREFPRCVAGSLRVRVGTERRRPPESDGRIPAPEGAEGGQNFHINFRRHICSTAPPVGDRRGIDKSPFNFSGVLFSPSRTR